MKFEAALENLENINDRLERDQVSLEEAIELYEKGTDLIELCREKLEAAEGDIKKLAEENGETVFEDFDR